MSAPVSRYPVPALADLPDDIRARILGATMTYRLDKKATRSAFSSMDNLISNRWS